ncbi:MAG TPA: FtsX-like permease family protein, partial [Sedimentibacter sp.]|nr:FtsX-like permease family protein [Sedimentibacter sp.]
KEADQANRIMTVLLGGIAAVSLLVGGIGIMNIMLVAVTERTSEIGVRRALGAKKEDLLIQFLLEAVYVSIIGCVAGIVLGAWAISIVAKYGLSAVVSLDSIRIAVFVALTSGLLFGVYPAINASNLPPVEALKRQ